MLVQLKSYQWECDGCDEKSEIIQSRFKPKLLKGWKSQANSSGRYLELETFCPDCKDKYKYDRIETIHEQLVRTAKEAKND